MPTGPREEDQGSDVRESKRPRYREDPDRLTLIGPSFSLAFSTLANGAIASLHHQRTGVELIESGEAAAEGTLWIIRLVSRTGATVTVTSRTCHEFTHSVSADPAGALRLRLLWTGLRAGAALLPGEVVAEFTASPDASTIAADLSFVLPEGISVGAVEFPRIVSLGAADPSTEENLFLPLGDGLLIPDPRLLTTRLEGRSWEAEYPGPASLQMIGYSRAPGVALWLSCRDASGAHKALVAGGMPHSNRLTLGLVHYPQSAEGGRWELGYQTTLGMLSGDWYEVAREYRRWAIRQPWCSRGHPRERHLPALTSAQGMWLSHWGGGESANQVVRDLVRYVNAPIRLDWRDWPGAAPPDYFPPRDGDQGFAHALRELADSGVYVQLVLDGLRASRNSQAWQTGEAQGAVADDTPESPVMCPAAAYWRSRLAALAAQATARGAEGLYLQGLGRNPPQVCRGAPHTHPYDGPLFWTDAVRGLLGAVREAVGESYQLAADGPSESCLEFLDAFLSEHTAAERLASPGELFGERWQPLPWFTSVYHEYCAHIASGPSLLGSAPHDSELLPQEVAHLQLPSYLAMKDFQAQFCLEIARGLVWGRQLALTTFAPEQARDERNRRKLAFLAAALRAQTWGLGALLPEAECLGLLAVEAPPLEMEMLIYPWDGAIEPHVTRKRIAPVLGSAWRLPSGASALVMANLHDHPVPFSTRLQPGRILLNPPLHPVGRTFSEDGDAPAATLRTSGTEISGRLPSRCILLVTLP